MQSIQENIFDLARGAAQPHVYPDDIKRLPIPKVPLDIQQKVVEECQKLMMNLTALACKSKNIVQKLLKFSMS